MLGFLFYGTRCILLSEMTSPGNEQCTNRIGVPHAYRRPPTRALQVTEDVSNIHFNITHLQLINI